MTSPMARYSSTDRSGEKQSQQQQGRFASTDAAPPLLQPHTIFFRVVSTNGMPIFNSILTSDTSTWEC
ncbi:MULTISPECIES: hypothetical protein [unclassified Nostoc]|uniref:hypothetical protein n=1 Tax=unclassified Nostoc TaxID=2593658 RepID=UPI0025DBDE2C|nr:MULTISPECIES: hypothetical protein [unclassified Nostoc]